MQNQRSSASVQIEIWKICAAFARKEVNFTGHSHYAWFQHHGNWTQRLTKTSQLKPGCSFYCPVLFVSLCFLTSCFWEQYLEKAPFIAPGADPGFGQGGAQLLRPKVADIAKRSRTSEASILRPGSRARLRALEAFGFLMLKYAFSHILETLFLLFLTSILTPKVDKNRALDFTSINLRHSDMLHLFFNLHEKVML